MELGNIEFDGLDWDSSNSAHCRAHGVAIDAIESFFNQRLLYFEDHRHSFHEKRWIAVGLDKAKRYLFVAFTFRKVGSAKLLRPISARYCHKKEQIIYEKIKEKIQED